MTSPTDLTLKEFTALQDKASELIGRVLDVLEEQTGYIVQAFSLKRREDDSYEMKYVLTMPDTDEKVEVTPKEDDQK